jgi:hypothetical protein
VLSTTRTVATRTVTAAGIRLISRAEAKCGAVIPLRLGTIRRKVKPVLMMSKVFPIKEYVTSASVEIAG